MATRFQKAPARSFRLLELAVRPCGRFGIVIYLLFAAIAPPASAEVKYTVRLLEYLPNPSQSTVRAINDAGELAGRFTYDMTGWGSNVAFRTTAEAGLEFLGSLDGTNSEARAMNNLGQVAGNSQVKDQWFTRGFVWTPESGMSDIGTLGGDKTSVYDMNDLGQVVGVSDRLGNPWNLEPNRAFRYTPGVGMLDLGTLGGSNTYAFGINNRGWVAGFSTLDDYGGYEDAFRYTDELGMQDLGVPFGAWISYGYAINNSGIVVGTGVFDWDFREAAIAVSNRMASLGVLLDGHSSEALDINDRNVVVGHAYVVGPVAVEDHGFVWTSNDGMLDLNYLTILPTNLYLIEQAMKINKPGQILCVGSGNGNPVPLVLDPIPPKLTIAPNAKEFVISWSPVWADYVLEGSQTPGKTDWAEVPTPSTNQISFANGPKSQFFRLRRLTDEEVQTDFQNSFP